MVDTRFSAEDTAWDAFVAAHPQGHVLQTSRWARLKCAFGWQAARAVLRAGGAADAPIVAGASLLFRRLPWGQSLAYAPKGPLVDWANRAQVQALLAEVRRVCGSRHAALLKMEPNLLAGTSWDPARHGLRPSPQRVQPLSTILVDLARCPEDILASMKPKWRYNVRLAERKGVTVREGGPADMQAIRSLLEVTGQRDGFGVHSLAYYTAAAELFGPPGIATWLLAEHEGQMLGAIAVFACAATGIYMWGASSDEGRNLMPNHALQWAGMQWAKARGCTCYDLWGIPDEVGLDPAAYAEPESWGEGGLWGVYRFKQGFGGQVVRFAGAYDLPLSSPGYALYRLALRVRRSWLAA